MGVTVEIKGGDKFPNVFKQLENMKLAVKAGFFGGSTNGDTGASIPYYAFINEFGTTIKVTPKMRAWFHYHDIHLKKGTNFIKIPARPFMRTTASEQQSHWAALLAKQVEGKSNDPAAWKGACYMLGQEMQANIQNAIQNGSWTPNAAATVKLKAAKGKGEANHPLMDTGDMFAAVKYEVMEG